MVFKIIIGDKGKAWNLEMDSDVLVGKSLGEKVDGKELKSELEGYELQITGGSDIAGFPMYEKLEGLGRGRVLLSKGWGMHDNREGVRRRKTVRGKVISDKISQINMKVLKHGHKKLEEVFPAKEIPVEAPKA